MSKGSFLYLPRPRTALSAWVEYLSFLAPFELSAAFQKSRMISGSAPRSFGNFSVR